MSGFRRGVPRLKIPAGLLEGQQKVLFIPNSGGKHLPHESPCSLLQPNTGTYLLTESYWDPKKHHTRRIEWKKQQPYKLDGVPSLRKLVSAAPWDLWTQQGSSSRRRWQS